MSKRRFRVEPFRYGGELLIGKVSWDFAEAMLDADDDAVWEALQAWENASTVEEFVEDTGLPRILEDEEPGRAWFEFDDFEHHSGGFSDCEWAVTEVPADGSDDFGYGLSDEAKYTDTPIQVFTREAYHQKDLPDDSNEHISMDDFVGCVSVFSSEKGGMGAWFVETDGEDFDFRKLGYAIIESHLAELIEALWYDGEQLEPNYDNMDTMGKAMYASTGFFNTKWWDSTAKTYDNEEWMKDAMEYYQDEMRSLLEDS